MVRYRATLAYDGTAYQGFQRQAGDTPTIQGSVEKALHKVSGQDVTVIGAGRTDTGVHASGQVIAFDCEWKHSDGDLLRALNATLPVDMALQSLCQQPGFHPRFDAVSRVYRYWVLITPQRQPLLLNRVWQLHQPLDLNAMQQAAVLLVGEHDFATFGQPPQGDNTVREVFQSVWERQAFTGGEVLAYTIAANAFLYRMVRRIVGMLVHVGQGMRTVAAFEAAFRSNDIAEARTLAPPQGLVLEAVVYTKDNQQDDALPIPPIVGW